LQRNVVVDDDDDDDDDDDVEYGVEADTYSSRWLGGWRQQGLQQAGVDLELGT
jgi:hypothetical protein